jgi:ankyrin repeat protein
MERRLPRLPTRRANRVPRTFYIDNWGTKRFWTGKYLHCEHRKQPSVCSECNRIEEESSSDEEVLPRRFQRMRNSLTIKNIRNKDDTLPLMLPLRCGCPGAVAVLLGAGVGAGVGGVLGCGGRRTQHAEKKLICKVNTELGYTIAPLIASFVQRIGKYKNCPMTKREAVRKNSTAAILVAANGKDVRFMQDAIDKGGNVNAQYLDGSNISVLHRAAKTGCLEMVQLLIDSGADIHARSIAESTPLHYSAKYGHPAVANLLINSGADVYSTTGNGVTSLHYASKQGSVDVAELLINYGADVNSVSQSDFTPMHYAAIHGKNKIIKLLIKVGTSAIIHSKTSHGCTPLHYAAKYGGVKVFKRLIAAGANINSVDVDDRTPLHYAAVEGHDNIIGKCIDAEANVNMPGGNRRTPILYEACISGNEKSITQLIDAGAYIDDTDSYGRTPLFGASSCGNTNICKMLLKYGANVNHITRRGYTPFLIAANGGYSDTVALLQAYGADVILSIKEGAKVKAYD